MRHRDRKAARPSPFDYAQKAREVINVEIAGIEKVRDGLGEQFGEAVELILQCLAEKAKIVVTGIGKNYHIAQKISATLASTGSTSVVLNPAQAMHGDLGIFNPGDVLLALSYSGESEEIFMLIPMARRLGVKVVSMIGQLDGRLCALSDVVIPVTVDREACPFNMAPTTSTTATLAVGDALAMVLLEARGFKREDYAKLHPGGAIGRSLLLRVSDIMRSGERLACVRKGARVKDALMAMTKARAGSSGVVDENGKAIGIFTDGDLRRHIAERVDLMEALIEEVMTPSPIAVHPDQLAAEALQIYETHSIDDLLVVDDEGLLRGAVDIQDLPKLKIM